MKILITGGEGFLGGYIVNHIKPHFDLVVFDKDNLDVTDFNQVMSVLEAEKPDIVMHLAALCGAIPSVNDPLNYLQVNTEGTIRVIEACRRLGINKFIFTSSLTVYGSTQNGIEEDSSFAPRHPYSTSKAMCELLIRNYCRCYGLTSIIMRPTLVVGEGCSELHAIGDFLKTILEDKVIEIFGDGCHQRDFIHPDDVATATLACLKKLVQMKKSECESYNFSSGEVFKLKDLADLVISTVGKGNKKLVNPTSQTFSLFTSINKASRDLGWAPKIKVKDILYRLMKANNIK